MIWDICRLHSGERHSQIFFGGLDFKRKESKIDSVGRRGNCGVIWDEECRAFFGRTRDELFKREGTVLPTPIKCSLLSANPIFIFHYPSIPFNEQASRPLYLEGIS